MIAQPQIDPRSHRHVVSVNGDRLTYVCGCVNVIDAATGALRSVAKCEDHQRARTETGELRAAYYRSNGALDPDAPARYTAELEEAVGPLSSPVYPWLEALEVGCGTSPYVPALSRNGWRYRGLDASAWACRWVRWRYVVPTVRAEFEAWEPDCQPGLILSAHAIEHMIDAPVAIAKMAAMLAPGGQLILVTPDDTDPINPDHQWYFGPRSLMACVESAGLRVAVIEIHQRIERERFIYLRAIKP